MHLERHKKIPVAAWPSLLRTCDRSDEFGWFDVVREGVKSGRMECWHVDGHSWAVTQTWTDPEDGRGKQLVWCYAGRDVKAFAQAMYRVAQDNGLSSVRFSTFHRALPRLLKSFQPVCVAPTVYEIRVH